VEKRQSLQQMVLGKLDSHMQKNETGPFPYTTHKNNPSFWLEKGKALVEAVA